MYKGFSKGAMAALNEMKDYAGQHPLKAAGFVAAMAVTIGAGIGTANLLYDRDHRKELSKCTQVRPYSDGIFQSNLDNEFPLIEQRGKLTPGEQERFEFEIVKNFRKLQAELNGGRDTEDYHSLFRPGEPVRLLDPNCDGLVLPWEYNDSVIGDKSPVIEK